MGRQYFVSNGYDRLSLIRVSTTAVTAWTFRVLAWGTIAWLIGLPAAGLLTALALATWVVALAAQQAGLQSPLAKGLLASAVIAHLLLLAATMWPQIWPCGVPAGFAVFTCLAISYLVDVRRSVVVSTTGLAALPYMVQLPVFPAGPLSRFHEFRQQLARTDVTMASFSYGVRRIVTGWIKVYLLAAPLASTADEIFALPVTRLSTDTAWLGAICAALEVYFYASGFSDVGIGLGRILGFRHQENFRRPYAADSIREFWRRWNVTLVTWLRDYGSLPIAGHDAATMRHYVATVLGFIVIGLWLRTSLHVLPWAVFTATWLAAESIGLGRLMHHLPRVVRHVYVLLIVTFGWMLLRASGPGPLLGYGEAMLGFSIVKFGAASAYLSLGLVTALVSAVVFAGPLVGWISRWRVSVDAAVASLLMMMAATGVLLWHAVAIVRRITPRDHSN